LNPLAGNLPDLSLVSAPWISTQLGAAKMSRCGTLARKVQRIVFLANEPLLETESQQALGHHFETLHLLHLLDGVLLHPQAASLRVEMEITSEGTC
jgi:hypothetical protein